MSPSTLPPPTKNEFVQTTVPPLKRPWWMFSGHLETIFCLFDERRRKPIPYETHVISTFDGDQVVMQWKSGAPDKPLIVIFHGLEGCARTRAVDLVARHFTQQNWTVAIPHFRSCGMMNLFPRAYHAADGRDPKWMLHYLCVQFDKPFCYAVGVSLGGNALIHALDTEQSSVRAAATVSAPLNLTAAADRINHGLAHFIYGRHFIKKLREKIKIKCRKFPSICSPEKLRRIRTIGDFDSVYTAPVHGFSSAAEYWEKGTALSALDRMKTPLLCINSTNDPMVPTISLPQTASSFVKFSRPKHGGHGGFFGNPRNWLGETIQQFFGEAEKHIAESESVAESETSTN